MILVLDGHNLMHRARSGFQLGDYNVVFNFVRQLRALVEQFQPTRVYFTLEGAPKRQLQLLSGYKANRVIDEADEKAVRSRDSFLRQKDLIVEMLQKHFPISVVQHPDFEADDVIHNLIRNSSKSAEFTVVSTDTDFIQLLQAFDNVRLYNPVTKKLVEAPPYNYCIWKALRGDPSDNVPGLVGEAKALELVTDRYVSFVAEAYKDAKSNLSADLARNITAISFHDWTPEETLGMRSSEPTRDWERVRELFQAWSFGSLLKEGTWAKFVATFDPLWKGSEDAGAVV
jgi:5'-3' exonuclease